MTGDDQELLGAIAKVVADQLGEHVGKLHTLGEPEVARLIAEHTEYGEAIRVITRELHGERNELTGQWSGGMVEQLDKVYQVLTNGGVKAELPTTIKVAIITTLGLVGVAFVTGLFGLLTGG